MKDKSAILLQAKQELERSGSIDNILNYLNSLPEAEAFQHLLNIQDQLSEYYVTFLESLRGY